MNILFASSELYPWVKTGGLADVSRALPEALLHEGLTVTIVIPGYRELLAALGPPKSIYQLQDDFISSDISIGEYDLPDSTLSLLVVHSESLFERPGSPYLDIDGKDWPDNGYRFAQFCRAITALLNPETCNYPKRFQWVHCNDWQTGLVPPLVKLNKLPVKSLITIHNLAYQGVFERHVFDTLKLPDSWWHYEKLEFYGSFSFLKAGIVYADKVTTVSPTYAQEILAEPMGCGMAGLLHHYRYKLTGILNGVDYQIWNPATDPHLVANYDHSSLDKKSLNRSALLARFGLLDHSSLPLFGMVTRLAYQKGVDWLLDIIIRHLPTTQWVILGSGDVILEKRLHALVKQYPNHIGVSIGYNEALAHQIEAGIDVFVMPSRYEPCGLNQLYSLRYGSLPLVHETGGLADTVENDITGFVFSEPTADALSKTIDHAVAAFQHSSKWRRMQITAMQKQYNWQTSAQAYKQLYMNMA